MTDVEMQRIKTICEVACVDDIGDLSDGFHTFNSLYEQRMILFAALVKAYKDKAWKSYRHEDGEYCFGGGWFIVGIDTPEGSYTYHYENKYFDLFDCEILDYSKHWDGHTEKDVTRLLTLPSVQPELDERNDPNKKLPETSDDVLAIVDGVDENGTFTHLPFVARYWPDSGWYLKADTQPFEYTVYAWFDIPYVD